MIIDKNHKQSYILLPSKDGHSQTGSNVCGTGYMTGSGATTCKQEIMLL